MHLTFRIDSVKIIYSMILLKFYANINKCQYLLKKNSSNKKILKLFCMNWGEWAILNSLLQHEQKYYQLHDV